MTNKLALVLAIVLIAIFATDAVLYDGRFAVLLGKKTLDLITLIAFWH